MALASEQKRMMLISREGLGKYGPTDRRRHNGWLRDARLSALAVLQCPGQVEMPAC